jgi:hypothetical protein
MEDLGDLRIGQQRFQMRRVRVPLRDLNHIGAAVAVRQLHHAKPVAMRIEAHGLGIDRHRVGVAGEVGQVATVQAYGHEMEPQQLHGIRRFGRTLAPKSAGGERQGGAFRP